MSKQTDLLNLTDAISVDGSNNVGIGTSNVGYVDANRNTLQVNGPTSSIIALAYGGTNAGYMYADSNTTQLWSEGSREFNMGTAAAGPITFKTNNTERMRIDNAGRVTTPYQPAFRAGYPSPDGNSALVSGDVYATSAAPVNRGNHFNTSNYRFVAPVAGCYYFSATVWGQPNAATSAAFRVNGTQPSAGTGDSIVAIEDGDTMSRTVNLQAVLALSANDYVTLNARNGGALIYTGHTWWQGYLIG